MKPVPEAAQGAYYRQAVELAFCQPNVRGLFLFHAVDERDLNRWQSGLFYVDRSAKSDLLALRAAISHAHRGVVTHCPGSRCGRAAASSSRFAQYHKRRFSATSTARTSSRFAAVVVWRIARAVVPLAA